VATQEDVRAIASALPGAVEGTDRFGFSVPVKGKFKGFLWTWAERVHPKKPKVINEGVIAVVVPTQLAKDLLLASDPAIYFTEDHNKGFLGGLVADGARLGEHMGSRHNPDGGVEGEGAS